MSWIKTANQLGKYYSTYRGFRIYIIKEPDSKESIVERNGVLYKKIDLINGEMVAIDKTGVIIKGHHVDAIGSKIDIELMRRYHSKIENRTKRTYTKRLSKSEKRAKIYLK